MRVLLTRAALVGLLLGCGSEGRPPAAAGKDGSEPDRLPGAQVPMEDTVTHEVPASPPPRADSTEATPAAGSGPAPGQETDSGAPRDSPVPAEPGRPPAPLPPPVRPPDTVGTRRPIPARTPPTVVPESGTAARDSAGADGRLR